MATIGELSEAKNELIIEWRIKDFFSLSEEKDIFYIGQRFYFSGASWEFKLYPNGEAEYNTAGWVSLYLVRMSTGSPLNLNYTFGLKTIGGRIENNVAFTNMFEERNTGYGSRKLIIRENLMKKRSEFTPSDILTVICTLKNSAKNPVAGSLFIRQKKIIDNLKELRAKGEKTDCTLKVDGQNIPAHRMILKTASPVFAAMFTHDTSENRTGEVLIDDLEKNAVEFIIEYVYSGDTRKFETGSVLSVYGAAEKYGIQDIKEMCLQFIKTNLSVDWVCDVIKFSELYSEEEIGLRAREYFKENARKIFETEKWKKFAKENHDLSVELLTSVVVVLLPK